MSSAADATQPLPGQQTKRSVILGSLKMYLTMLGSIRPSMALMVGACVGLVAIVLGLSLLHPVPIHLPIHLHVDLVLDLRATVLPSIVYVFFKGHSITSASCVGSAGSTAAANSQGVGVSCDVVENSEARGVDAQVQADLPLPDKLALPEDTLRAIARWRYFPSAFEQERKLAEAKEVVDNLYTDLAHTFPALVYRFSPAVMNKREATSSTPTFRACGHLWTLCMGPMLTLACGSSNSQRESRAAVLARYFVLKPRGHCNRLQFLFVLAKKPGEGFKERRVQDWPPELAGHPWGPSVPAEDIECCLQDDGSLIVMIQPVGLGMEGEDE